MVMKQVHQAHQALQDRLQQHSLRCPRCDSGNTKFCYYNNYSLLQPRHFCRACKRYWTRGGTLRSVPVGGGSRKNSKRNKKPKVGVGGGVGESVGCARKNEVNRMLYGLEIKNQTDSSDLSYLSELSTSCNGYGIDQSHYNNGFSATGIESTSSAQEIHDVMNLSTNFVTFPGYESSFTDSSLVQPPLMLDGLEESVTTSQEQAMFADLMPVAKEVKIEQGNDLMGNKFDFATPCYEPMSSSDSTLNWSMIWPDLANYGSSIASLM